MPGRYPLRRLRRHLQSEGILATASAVVSHSTSAFVGAFEGKPGYHAATIRYYTRYYDAETITPRWVSPADIRYLTGEYDRQRIDHLDYVPHFGPRERSQDWIPYEVDSVPFGAVIGGDWDQAQDEFTRLLLYQGLEQWLSGTPWEKTIYFEELVADFEADGWSGSEAASLAGDRCESLKSIYRRIEAQGYQSQRQLRGHPLHEVIVTIGRDGEYRYNSEGRHRLAIAKVLDVEEIPVLVLVTHPEYEGDNQANITT